MSIFAEKFTCCINNHSKYKSRCFTWVKWLLSLEMLLEDIPQLVLTILVLKARNGGEWSPVAVFNATTSGFNFTFNLLDMCMPLDKETEDNLREQKKFDNDSGDGNTTASTTNKMDEKLIPYYDMEGMESQTHSSLGSATGNNSTSKLYERQEGKSDQKRHNLRINDGGFS